MSKQQDDNMSYEKRMLENFKMPTQKEVERALLKSLFNNNGTIKEFGTGETIVEEIASDFNLNDEQRLAYLETVYRKENRVKKSYLWHRLLFRAADSLAKQQLVSRPTQTVRLTNKKEWMLTENGYSKALEILRIPITQKEVLPIKSYEVQKIIKGIYNQPRPENYDPFGIKKVVQISGEAKLRNRAFIQAVKEAYDFRCAVCGMKIHAPTNNLQWEVEAAHIVPHSKNGKDDLLNGLALCRLHHWAFDVGWFTLEDDFKILISDSIEKLPPEFGRFGSYEFLRHLSIQNTKIYLPDEPDIYPHSNAIKWHRENIFCR
jgi:hypothetical protein